MSETGAPAPYRVVYVGGRRFGGFFSLKRQPERTWRQRLANEMEEVCQEMASHGLRLFTVVPIKSSASFQGGWTDGAWLYFAAS